MAKPRVFASFDFDNDLNLKNLFVGQSKHSDSPFELEDWSLKEEQPQANWEEEARKKIRRSTYFIVIVGAQTHRASGVKKEIAIAIEERKARYQIKSATAEYPWVNDGGTHLNWTWENLKNHLV